MFLITLN